jgi:hypothetical protein
MQYGNSFFGISIDSSHDTKWMQNVGYVISVFLAAMRFNGDANGFLEQFC